jgi:small GTP-binding protein
MLSLPVSPIRARTVSHWRSGTFLKFQRGQISLSGLKKPVSFQKFGRPMKATGRRCDYSAKTIIVGDSGVGKTSILVRFCRQTFDESRTATVGVEFLSKVIEHNNHRIELQLWDTAGQEVYRSVTRGYYRDAMVTFFVYDITQRPSFEHVQSWFKDASEVIRTEFIAILLGNKSDLEDERSVSRAEGEEFAKQHNMAFFEVSAKSGATVPEAMQACLEGVWKWIEDGKLKGAPVGDFVLTDGDEGGSSSCC